MVGLKEQFMPNAFMFVWELESDHGGIEREPSVSVGTEEALLESDHGGIESTTTSSSVLELPQVRIRSWWD